MVSVRVVTRLIDQYIIFQYCVFRARSNLQKNRDVFRVNPASFY